MNEGEQGWNRYLIFVVNTAVYALDLTTTTFRTNSFSQMMLTADGSYLSFPRELLSEEKNYRNPRAARIQPVFGQYKVLASFLSLGQLSKAFLAPELFWGSADAFVTPSKALIPRAPPVNFMQIPISVSGSWTTEAKPLLERLEDEQAISISEAVRRVESNSKCERHF